MSVTPIKNDKREQQETYDRKANARNKRNTRERDLERQKKREQKEERWKHV